VDQAKVIVRRCLLLLPAAVVADAHAWLETADENTARLQPGFTALREALAARDPVAVRRAVRTAVQTLGPLAGQPDRPTRHYPPADRRPFSRLALGERWLDEVDLGLESPAWRADAQADPRAMRTGLRTAATTLDALVRTVLLFPEYRGVLEPEIREGADWLVRRQRSDGLFPFPAGPGLNPHDKVGRVVRRLVKAHPRVLVDGWIVDDRGDGGLQVDHAACGSALIGVWRLTGDVRYLHSVRGAAAWASERPLVPDWVYTACSVGLLARLAEAVGERGHLDAAVAKADAGVLPGQLPGGRWFDPRNAGAVEHRILMRDLLALLHALPSAHPFRARVLDAVRRGLNQAASETLRRGSPGLWADIFAQGLLWIGEHANWRGAMTVCVNAAGRGRAPPLGTAALAVLELGRAGR
jgi:hypothetical protein